jgi:hypothetical protein
VSVSIDRPLLVSSELVIGRRMPEEDLKKVLRA